MTGRVWIEDERREKINAIVREMAKFSAFIVIISNSFKSARALRLCSIYIPFLF